MHLIPNIALGKVSNRSVTWVFFPRMYPLGAREVGQEELAQIYDHCVWPVMLEIANESASHWPVSYQAGLCLFQKDAGPLAPGTVDIPWFQLENFTPKLLEKLAHFEKFRDAYFVHKVRGIKLANVHELDNEKAAQEMYDQALEFLDRNKLDPGQWFADVGLETFYLDHIVCWFTDGHAELLWHLLPDMEDARLERMVHGSRFKKDQINLLSQASGFRLELPSTHAI